MCRTAYATIEEYPLWVGGTQVTSENTSWTDDPYRGGWSYDVDTNTLTLDALTIYGGYEEDPDYYNRYISGIRYSGSRPLIISLKGNNLIAVTSNEDERTAIGIFSDQGQVAIRQDDGTGNASLEIGTYGSDGTGIRCQPAITLESGTVTVGTEDGSSAYQDSVVTHTRLDVKGGTLNIEDHRQPSQDVSFGIRAPLVNLSGGTIQITSNRGSQKGLYITREGSQSQYGTLNVTGGKLKINTVGTGIVCDRFSYALIGGGEVDIQTQDNSFWFEDFTSLKTGISIGEGI